jgi:hypothetical protein
MMQAAIESEEQGNGQLQSVHSFHLAQTALDRYVKDQ